MTSSQQLFIKLNDSPPYLLLTPPKLHLFLNQLIVQTILLQNFKKCLILIFRPWKPLHLFLNTPATLPVPKPSQSCTLLTNSILPITIDFLILNADPCTNSSSTPGIKPCTTHSTSSSVFQGATVGSNTIPRTTPLIQMVLYKCLDNFEVFLQEKGGEGAGAGGIGGAEGGLRGV